ncbi:hypothetical protein OC846_006056 [Tilletia horrida]|uniref:Uncharacterized protein n=1 Tax=Tilletia horrida TaxID=155126 RepID=A0AAN6JPC2_9BASI|nr:hypothetical protein OC846_006056 [Tilletia horrida]
MSKAGANGATEASLEPYTGTEQENLLRARLLTEDRPFRRIVRKVTLLTTPELREDANAISEGSSSSTSSPSPSTSKLTAALGSVQIELAALAHTAKRFSFLASTALPAQRASYQTQVADLDEAIAAHEADILTLQTELELVQRERANKLIYDHVARQINALPTRRELNEHLDRLRRDNAALRADGAAYDELDQSARARFRAEVCDPLELLQKILGDEVGRRERSAVERAQERGEDVDAEVAALEAEAAKQDAAAEAAKESRSGEPEPGEVEEGGEAIESTAGPSKSNRSRGPAAAAASSRTSLRASAPDFTPGGKSRLASASGANNHDRIASPVPAPSRKRPRLASATATATAAAASAEEEGEIDDDEDGGEAPSGQASLSSLVSKGKSKTAVAIDDDTASSLTSLDDLMPAAETDATTEQGRSSAKRPADDDDGDDDGEGEEEGDDADEDALEDEDGADDDDDDDDDDGDSPAPAAAASKSKAPRRGRARQEAIKAEKRRTKKAAVAAAAAVASSSAASTTGGGGGRRGARTALGRGSGSSAPGGSGSAGKGGGGSRSASPTTTTSAPARKRRR